ncbi:MAG: diguanylate cyclase [Candidatus Gastranaerophilales bacterium]|nr:diguanylate cyclase [Candidatus Gastranaerophilales bacterium]
MSNFFNLLYRHRYDIFYSLILITLVLLMIIIFPKKETKNILNELENKTFDIRQNIIAKDKKVNKDIVIVTVDDPSYEYLLETYGDWPIPRNVYAEILDYIQAQNPKYVAFDLLFIKSLKRIPKSDDKLIEALKKYSNTYTAMNFDNYPFEMRKPPLIDKKLTSDIKINSDNIKPFLFTNHRELMKEITNATDKIGHANTPRTDDGFIREIPVFICYPRYNQEDFSVISYDYYLYMTIKLAIDYLNKYENANIKSIEIDSNNNILLGNRIIPLTDKAQTILNWYGETGVESDKTFKYIPFWKVLKSIKAKENGEQELIPSDMFKDKIVYIGTSIYDLSDIKTVPTSKYLPGVEIHATLLNNILDNNLIHKAALSYNLLISILLAFAAAFTAFKIRSVYISIMLFSLFLGFYMYFAAYVMTKYNVWVWIVIPLVLAIFVFICSFIIKYLLKSRDFEYTYKLATTDGLTELYNHRFFQEQMKNKITEYNKTKNKFSLVMTDIDFFKKFNDKYGHQAGDAVLKHVAKTLKSNTRNEDFVCRYGGEEMAVILNNTNKERAIEIAKKLCNAISSQKYDLTPELEVSVTISLGVSTYPDNGKTPAELIEYADKCLYIAKENGRNQVGFIE